MSPTCCRTTTLGRGRPLAALLDKGLVKSEKECSEHRNKIEQGNSMGSGRGDVRNEPRGKIVVGPFPRAPRMCSMHWQPGSVVPTGRQPATSLSWAKAMLAKQ